MLYSTFFDSSGDQFIESADQQLSYKQIASA